MLRVGSNLNEKRKAREINFSGLFVLRNEKREEAHILG
jgi:hypothetical protein